MSCVSSFCRRRNPRRCASSSKAPSYVSKAMISRSDTGSLSSRLSAARKDGADQPRHVPAQPRVTQQARTENPPLPVTRNASASFRRNGLRTRAQRMLQLVEHFLRAELHEAVLLEIPVLQDILPALRSGLGHVPLDQTLELRLPMRL